MSVEETGAPERSSRPPGPEQLAMPTDGVEPLAAMTKLDALRERVGPVEREWESTWWRAKAPIERSALWVTVEHRRGGEERLRWLLVRPGRDVEYRRARLVRALVALADAELALEPADRPQELAERAERWVEQRRERLRAVALAPVPLTWDAPPYRVWRRICEAVESGALDVDGEEMGRLRDRMLRPFPRGTERKFEELCDADPPPERLLRTARRIADLFEPVDAEIDLRIRSGVQLLPRPP